jgi:hypothetical protein
MFTVAQGHSLENTLPDELVQGLLNRFGSCFMALTCKPPVNDAIKAVSSLWMRPQVGEDLRTGIEGSVSAWLAAARSGESSRTHSHRQAMCMPIDARQ